MLVTVRGIVVSVKDTGENDRILTVITDALGSVDIYARGVRKLNAKNSASSQLFAYASFCMDSRKGRYYLTSSEPVNIFFGIRTDITRLALASYIADVLKYAVTTEEQPSEETMRLVLNIFYFLSEGKRDCALLKSIFELRFACCIGMMPRLAGCAVCSEYEAEKMYFLPDDGILLCGDHYDGSSAEYFELDKTLLHTIRYICLTSLEKCFGFDLRGETLGRLGVISEKYLIGHLGHRFGTLDFYKSL